MEEYKRVLRDGSVKKGGRGEKVEFVEEKVREKSGTKVDVDGLMTVRTCVLFGRM